MIDFTFAIACCLVCLGSGAGVGWMFGTEHGRMKALDQEVARWRQFHGSFYDRLMGAVNCTKVEG